MKQMYKRSLVNSAKVQVENMVGLVIDFERAFEYPVYCETEGA